MNKNEEQLFDWVLSQLENNDVEYTTKLFNSAFNVEQNIEGKISNMTFAISTNHIELRSENNSNLFTNGNKYDIFYLSYDYDNTKFFENAMKIWTTQTKNQNNDNLEVFIKNIKEY